MIKFDVEFEECTIHESIACGIRQEWITAESENTKARLASGAGCGSPWAIIAVDVDGTRKHFRCNMALALEQAIELTRIDALEKAATR